MALSGGQRQRLALARAVLSQPAVLVLDDTLSALDVHTEALVEEALRRVLVDTTGVIVAHRASTVLLADRVALLQGGTITHVGEHRELLATVPAYRELLSADPSLEEAVRTPHWFRPASPAELEKPADWRGSPRPTRTSATSASSESSSVAPARCCASCCVRTSGRSGPWSRSSWSRTPRASRSPTWSRRASTPASRRSAPTTTSSRCSSSSGSCSSRRSPRPSRATSSSSARARSARTSCSRCAAGCSGTSRR